MASMVAKACSSSTNHISSAMMAPEKGSRNKRKFRADPPLADPNKIISSTQNEYPTYEFSAEKFEITPSHGHPSVCDICSFSHDNGDSLKLDLGLSCAVGSTVEVKPNRPMVEVEASEEFHDADWSDLTESQLEELVLANLDTIFKSAIKKIVACGYTEEVATKAVLRSGLYYGSKDTVSNIVDNTLIFLRNGQEINPMREHYFEDLKQMEKYILAELVCVLREVRPFFSTGDAMWCLLISDMNVSHACGMDRESFSSLGSDPASNGSPAEAQLKKEVKSVENLPKSSCKQNHSVVCAHNCPLEAPVMASIPYVNSSLSEAPTRTEASVIKPKTSFVLNGLSSEKEEKFVGTRNPSFVLNGLSSEKEEKFVGTRNPSFVLNGLSSEKEEKTSRTITKSFSLAGTSHSPVEENFVGTRKISGITKREYILRQKSIHLEKSYRTYGSKGGSRAGKLSSFGGLILDKKLKSVSDSTGIGLKNASLKISKAMGIGFPQDTINNNLSTQIGLSSPSAFSTETVNSTFSAVPKTNIPPALPLSVADTELSLSLPAKNNPAPLHEASNYATKPYEKSFGQWAPQDRKDEMILKLVPRARELQTQLQEWTEWANQKVMQAARRLGKDKGELKTLRQEKEEVERLKKEKQSLEENTMKKLSEMENALYKASGQVERANSAVRRLEVDNSHLRQKMEAAKLQAVESAAHCQEVSKREKKTLMQFQSWERQKSFFQEELTAEKRTLNMLQQELELAKDLRDQLEARWKQEEKVKEDLLTQATSFKKEREAIEALAQSKENMTKLKAEKYLQKYKEDIKKLEREISSLRLKSDSSKIAALRRGIDGTYASRLADNKTPPPSPSQGAQIQIVSKMVEDFHFKDGVKRERECVMCLSEEMSVVFLPCAHQVVCISCNELHEKQGMKECPSCRGPIQSRISVRYACS